TQRLQQLTGQSNPGKAPTADETKTAADSKKEAKTGPASASVSDKKSGAMEIKKTLGRADDGTKNKLDQVKGKQQASSGGCPNPPCKVLGRSSGVRGTTALRSMESGTTKADVTKSKIDAMER